MKDLSASKVVWQQDDVLCQKLLLSERGEWKMLQHQNPIGKKGDGKAWLERQQHVSVAQREDG